MDIIEKRAVAIAGSQKEIINQYQKPLFGRQTFCIVLGLQ